MIDPIAFARKLVDIASTTDHETEVAALLRDELSRAGYACREQPVAENRFNVFASAGGEPRVVLNSHMDTVPPWFASREDEDFLHGRGACDAKGAIAAMIAAGEQLRAEGERNFAFLFVVAEETDSIGAKSANVAFADLGARYVIVGEPTESTFARASKGALTCTIRFEGIAAHSGYPERGDSAIRKMLGALAQIEATDWGSDDVLGRATVNIGVIRAGEKPNIVPAVAECDVMLRTIGPPDAVRLKLEQIADRFGGRVTMSRGNPPQFMEVPAGAPSTVVAFNTDVAYLGNLGKPLLFGPGSILDAHGANERIRKSELRDAVTTYRDTVKALCRS